MFRTSIVHLQERSYAVCCNLIRPVVMRVKEELQFCELLNVMNKTDHQILCILLDYIYIAK